MARKRPPGYKPKVKKAPASMAAAQDDGTAAAEPYLRILREHGIRVMADDSHVLPAYRGKYADQPGWYFAPQTQAGEDKASMLMAAIRELRELTDDNRRLAFSLNLDGVVVDSDQAATIFYSSPGTDSLPLRWFDAMLQRYAVSQGHIKMLGY